MKAGAAPSTSGFLTRQARYATALLARLKNDPRTPAAAHDCRMILAAMREGRQSPQEAATAVRARLATLILTEIGLTYPWLVELALHDVVAEITTGRSGVILEAPDVPDLPRGRAPKAGDYLAQDVEWWWRFTVDRESAYAIAKADLGKVGAGHHRVQKSIARTIAALDRLDVEDTQPPR